MECRNPPCESRTHGFLLLNFHNGIPADGTEPFISYQPHDVGTNTRIYWYSNETDASQFADTGTRFFRKLQLDLNRWHKLSIATIPNDIPVGLDFPFIITLTEFNSIHMSALFLDKTPKTP